MDKRKSDTIIELNDIWYSYEEDRVILKELDFKLTDTDRVALLGPNGAGKTTLFHIIMGLLKPEKGEVIVFDKVRKNKNDFFEVRKRIGYLFQDSDDQLFSPTVIEDVAFGPLNLGIPRGEVRIIVSDVLKKLGLDGYENRITYKLSGGEKRLVALATVLAMKPEVLLLDEPVLGLDEEHKKRFINFLKDYNGSYLIISHDKDFIYQTTEKQYLLKDGVIMESD